MVFRFGNNLKRFDYLAPETFVFNDIQVEISHVGALPEKSLVFSAAGAGHKRNAVVTHTGFGDKSYTLMLYFLGTPKVNNRDELDFFIEPPVVFLRNPGEIAAAEDTTPGYRSAAACPVAAQVAEIYDRLES